MYGWRGRIGILTPCSNTTMECEFHKIAPEGVSIHTARLEPLPNITQDELRVMSYEMAAQIVFPPAEKAAQLVSSAGTSVIIYGTTSSSHLKGHGWNQDLTHRLEKTSKVKVVTASTAVEDALIELEINRLVLITPYTIKTTENEKEWLENRGFDVVNTGIHHLEDNTNVKIEKVHPELLYPTIKEAYRSNIDGVLISCTNLRSIEIIEILESDLGIPIISSNQACIWAGLKSIGIKEQINGYGKLIVTL